MSRLRRYNLWVVLVVIVLLSLLPLPAFWVAQLNYTGLFALTCLGLVLLTGGCRIYILRTSGIRWYRRLHSGMVRA